MLRQATEAVLTAHPWAGRIYLELWTEDFEFYTRDLTDDRGIERPVRLCDLVVFHEEVRSAGGTTVQAVTADELVERALALYPGDVEDDLLLIDEADTRRYNDYYLPLGPRK